MAIQMSLLGVPWTLLDPAICRYLDPGRQSLLPRVAATTEQVLGTAKTLGFGPTSQKWGPSARLSTRPDHPKSASLLSGYLRPYDPTSSQAVRNPSPDLELTRGPHPVHAGSLLPPPTVMH
eukprot:TRINITY_DN1609_c2_g1_i1.p5 TRINITY_DN1609_c2_g1~~TRINITY_DN1609_c2_g1_i1.p5  ORF type:complete len:121 (-),score=1.04 TRINITY_DN1609_c2_g1_i1:3186-3548(-)